MLKKRQDKYPAEVVQVSGFLRYETRTCGIPILKRQSCPDNSVENSRQKANNGRKLNYEKQNSNLSINKNANIKSGLQSGIQIRAP